MLYHYLNFGVLGLYFCLFIFDLLFVLVIHIAHLRNGPNVENRQFSAMWIYAKKSGIALKTDYTIFSILVFWVFISSSLSLICCLFSAFASFTYAIHKTCSSVQCFESTQRNVLNLCFTIFWMVSTCFCISFPLSLSACCFFPSSDSFYDVWNNVYRRKEVYRIKLPDLTINYTGTICSILVLCVVISPSLSLICCLFSSFASSTYAQNESFSAI
jgi:hypothetical protein